MAFIGILSAVVSGVLNGSFATPMKRMTKWEWENIWIIWAVWALIVIPLLLAIATVPELSSVYANTPTDVLLRTFLFGLGWGGGAVTFGLGLHMVGLSLGFSIIIGITAVTGALIPMLVFSPATVFTPGGMVIILGMVVTIIGVALCGSAGVIKERTLQKTSTQTGRDYRFKWGFVVCLASGLLNAMLNLAFVFGSPIAEVAKGYITGPLLDFRANNPVWALALSGAFLTNLLYCGMLLIRKGSWKKYAQAGTGSYWFWAFLMGLIWISCIVLYGISASSLGKLGTTVAWVILMAVTILVGNIWGVLSGEWKEVVTKARRRMIQGSALLIGSVVLVSLGRYLIG